MATESIIPLRGFARIAVALLLFSFCLCQGAGAQTSSSVVATGPISAVASHPAIWGQVWQTAISSKGDLVIGDFEQAALYEFPAGGGAMITLAAPGKWASGGWANMALAIDPWDNLWIGQNWNAELERIPYDPVNHTWNMSDPGIITYQYSWNPGNQSFDNALTWFQAGAISFGPAINGTATMVVSAENVPALYSFSVDNSGNVTSGSTVIATLSARARSLAIDAIGNIYLYEDGGVSGIVEVPAGTTGLANDKSLARIDPKLANPTGVTVDANGNVYVSDSKAGVYFVPNEGGILNPGDSVLMAAVPAFANVDFDLLRGVLYIPTTPGEKGGWTAPDKTKYNDVVAVALSNLVFGSGADYVQGAMQTVDFGFASSETPASFEIVEAGAASPDFVIVSGGTCTAGTTYAAGSSCTINVAMLPHALGSVSASLEMLDANGNILATISLSGFGVVPAVVSGPPAGMQTHPATWGDVWQTAISSKGDLVVGDFKFAALYEFPGSGGAMITLAAPGTWASGGWANLAVAIDPWDNLWIGQNWNAELERIPYDPANHTWNMSDPGIITYQYSWNPGNQSFNNAVNWFQAGAITFGSAITNGTATLVVSAENVPALYSFQVDANGGVTSGATVLSSMKGRAKTLAVDNSGNIYLFEDGGASGVLRIPAGATNLASDQSLTRVDPNLSNPGGVAVDAAGNVYVGDNNNGVYLVPNEGGTPNPSDAFLLASVPAYANVDFDLRRGIMYVPTTPGSKGGWNGNSDVVAVPLANVNLGTGAAGTQGTAAAVNFGLGAGVTPEHFVIEEAGTPTPDFAISSGGTCATGTTYTAQSACSVNVALNPHVAGGVSGKLLMLDAQGSILASMPLKGYSQGAAISATPALENAIGSGLITPNEVATDAAGNSYVADAGLKKVLMYPVGATAGTAPVSVGAGFAGPTGVALNGAGDLFIADSGNVYEVPNAPSGLNAGGQKTLMSGLGSKLNLAVDGIGNLYVADPDHARVAKIGNPGVTLGAVTQIETDLTGFTAPSVVAVDGNDNLYVVDSPKLIEVQTDGTRTTVLPSLGAASGLAIDPSGAVYASIGGGTLRIPFVNGAFDTSSQTIVAPSVTKPTGLALDKSGNVFLADGSAENLHMVSTSAVLNLGSPDLGAANTANVHLLNIGNYPLSVTGFLSSDAVDFGAAGCSDPVAVAAACVATVTMNPMGPGVQGPISSVISVESNAAGTPVVVDASGVAAALAASKSTITVDPSANVLKIPVTVSVAPATGTGLAPTGQVILSVDGAAQPPATLSKGSVTITLAGIPAGTHTFSAQYIGDRVYGSSNTSSSGIVLKANPLVAVPDLQNPTYVLFLGNQNGKYIPYDDSLRSYYTNYVVSVKGAPGLVPTGNLSFIQGSTAQCGPNGPPTNALPVGSFTLDATGSATFPPGCLEITNVSNVPNEVTPQTITQVVYSGDANYAASTVSTTTNGSPISFMEIRQPSVSITPNPGAVTVSTAAYPATSSASTTLTITSLLGYGVSTNPAFPSSTPTLILNNYTLPIAFNCEGLPAHSTCTFSGGNYTDLNGVLHPDEVLVDTDPSKPATIKVTITTNVSAGTTSSQNSHSNPFEYAALFGLGLIGLGFSRKFVANKGFMVLICLLALGTAIAGLTACSTQILGNKTVLSTPPSSGSPYAVTVTAQQVGSIVVPSSQGPITLYGSTNQISLPYTLKVTVQ